MTHHALNADHKHFAYSALPAREQLKWPHQASIAVPIILHFECMAFDAPAGCIQDTRWNERRQPDLRFCAWYEYGNRVAIYRVLDLLDKYGLRATIAANALACEQYPSLVELFQCRGYEIVAHGIAANQMLSSAMSEEAERSFIIESLDRTEKACGTRPTGWIGQDYGESWRTPALLSELGIRYVADWPNDDQPYRMAGAGGLISLPASGEWDDQRLLWDRKLQAWHYPKIVSDALDTLEAEALRLATGRYLALSLHPWLIGAPHRVAYLEQTLKALAGRSGIWNAATASIAEHIFPLRG